MGTLLCIMGRGIRLGVFTAALNEQPIWLFALWGPPSANISEAPRLNSTFISLIKDLNSKLNLLLTSITVINLLY